CVMAVGCLISGFVIYCLSLPTHAQFGGLFKSVFDQYRSKLMLDDVLDDIARIMGDQTITLKSSQRDKYKTVWRYLRWHLIRDESNGNLTVKKGQDPFSPPPRAHKQTYRRHAPLPPLRHGSFAGLTRKHPRKFALNF